MRERIRWEEERNSLQKGGLGEVQVKEGTDKYKKKKKRREDLKG